MQIESIGVEGNSHTVYTRLTFTISFISIHFISLLYWNSASTDNSTVTSQSMVCLCTQDPLNTLYSH